MISVFELEKGVVYNNKETKELFFKRLGNRLYSSEDKQEWEELLVYLPDGYFEVKKQASRIV